MNQDAAYIGLLIVAAIAFPFIAFGVARLLAPRRPTTEKVTTYESGMQTRGETWVRFRSHYYVYALVFVLFDVETVFLYPWAVAYNALPLYAFLEGFAFVAILAAGLIYAWAKGDLHWT